MSPGCDVPWRDEVLTQCRGSQHPSSLLVEGAGRARVSATSAPLCHALVATGVVCHQCESLCLSRVCSIKDGALRFYHILHKEEMPRNACHLIFIGCSGCVHVSMGVHQAL